MKTSDEDLAIAAAHGDRDAFASLLTRRYDDLFRLAYRLTGNRADAEDITQDVCAALPAKLAHYRADSRFTTWAYRVVVNAVHDQRRRRATHARAADGWGDWEQNRRAAIAQDQDQIAWLTTIISCLSSDLRDTLALLIDDELTHSEAARVLGISEGTVSWRMSEIRKNLRAQAEQEQRS